MIEDVKQKLAAEVQALNYELSHTLPEALKKALSMGDLRENGDYHAALERQHFVQARLMHLRSRLERLSHLDLSKIPADRVGLGSRLEVRDLDTKAVEAYEVVISDAADFDGGQISVASPLGRALLDRRRGETVEITLPFGKRRLKIVTLTTIHDVVPEGD